MGLDSMRLRIDFGLLERGHSQTLNGWKRALDYFTDFFDNEILGILITEFCDWSMKKTVVFEIEKAYDHDYDSETKVWFEVDGEVLYRIVYREIQDEEEDLLLGKYYWNVPKWVCHDLRTVMKWAGYRFPKRSEGIEKYYKD